MPTDKQPLKIQLALQGGGAKIFALIAAIDAFNDLEKEGAIKVTRIAGTSAGALVGVLFAAGVTPEVIRDKIATFPLDKLWKRPSLRLLSRMAIARKIVSGTPIADESVLEDKLQEILSASPTGGNRPCFGDLKKRGRQAIVVACDVSMRAKKVFMKDDEKLIEALIATCALPFFFRTATQKATNPIMDGGLWSNLPTSELTADAEHFGRVVALSFVETKKSETPKNFLQLAAALLETAMASSTSKAQATEGVDLITLDPQGVSTFDFDTSRAILKNAEDARYKLIKGEVLARLSEILETPPEEIAKAKGRFETLIKSVRRHVHRDRAKTQDRRNKLALISTSYTSIPEVHSMQEELAHCLSRKFPKDISVYQELTAQFDAIQRPELAVANEAVYTFPFFLSFLRHSVWGVIPYGYHVALGVLIHKDHPAFEDLGDWEQKETGRPPLYQHPEWISHLLNHIYRSRDAHGERGKLYSVSGYLFNEIVPLIILESGSDRAQNHFAQCGKAIHRESSRSQQAHTDEIRSMPLVPEGLKQPDGWKCSAMIVDLADKGRIVDRLKELDDGFKIFRIPHGLSIPVGIGFSLLTYPKLTDKSHLWKELSNIAVGTLAPVESSLLDVGIRFSPA